MNKNHLILLHNHLETGLRDTTKKSYNEETAYKPQTVTKNRFQLLYNLQENDSPVDVPSEFSQSGKDYRSVVRVRNAM